MAIEYSVVEGRKAPLLSVLDLLDAAELALPEDGYCVLGLTDQNIYEGDDLDGTMRGRAFGVVLRCFPLPTTTVLLCPSVGKIKYNRILRIS